MTIDDIKWVFEDGLGDEFRVTYYRFYDYLAGPPETNTFTLMEINHRGVYLRTEYEKVIFIPYDRIDEVTKIL